MKKERERILKMVESGGLTVEEGLTLLELLEKDGKLAMEKQEKPESEVASTVKMEKSEEKDESDRKAESDKKDDSDKKDESYYKFHSAKEKIFEFVDTAFKKLKDIDIDFNFGKSIEMAHIYQQASPEFRDIDVHVSNGSLKIVPWDQPDVRVECQAKIYRVETVEEARTTFLNGVNFSIEDNRLNLQTHHKWMKVDAKMFIPQADYDKVRVRLYNGPIIAENMNVNDMKLDTANGKISLEGIKGKKVETETANGKIKVKRSYVEEFEAETINGTIKFEGDLQKGNLHTFNGNILCLLNGPVCETLALKATTGNIELYVPDEMAVSGELKSNLGSFELKLEGIQVLEEKSEIVQKLLRFQTMKQVENVMQVTSETKTGSIKIKPAGPDQKFY